MLQLLNSPPFPSLDPIRSEENRAFLSDNGSDGLLTSRKPDDLAGVQSEYDRPCSIFPTLKDSSALFEKSSDSLAMAERVEMCRRTVVVDGKVYSVKRQSESVFLLRVSDLATRYVVVTADSIDFHGFERFVWPTAADQISSFEKLDDAAAYYEKLTDSSKD